ncbi:MAG TPA: hypothetical protein VN615_08090 [Gaiellales bacterium]|nr:hypothetical protein [Gaiellales bacterium]
MDDRETHWLWRPPRNDTDVPSHDGEEQSMTNQTAIVAEIRPGMKPALEKRLQEGPPFDLAAEGFERHEVFVGDKDVVFVFTGPAAASQLARMAATPALFRHVLAMTGILAAPRMLQQTYRWDRHSDDEPAPSASAGANGS